MADEQAQATEEKPEATTPPELTEEQIEAAILKKFGVKSTELVKKTDPPKVLTETEKKDAEEKKRQEVLKYSLEKGIFTTSEHEEYLSTQQANKIDLMRKRFIANHPEEKNAGKLFDKIFRIDEEDEFDDGGDTPTPNKEKQLAIAELNKLADEFIDSKYGKIKGAEKKYEKYQESQSVINENRQLANQAIGEIPKKIEIKTGRDTYQLPVSSEDLIDAQKMIEESGVLGKKGLTQAELKETAALFIKGKRLDDIIKEVEEVAIKKTVEKMERGASGVEVIREVAQNGTASAFEEFNKKHGIGIRT